MQITIPQFLKLAAKSTINIENYLNASVILESVGNPTNPTENITTGTILNDEFVDMASKIISYMNSNGTAPNNITDTSVGSIRAMNPSFTCSLRLWNHTTALNTSG